MKFWDTPYAIGRKVVITTKQEILDYYDSNRIAKLGMPPQNLRTGEVALQIGFDNTIGGGPIVQRANGEVLTLGSGGRYRHIEDNECQLCGTDKFMTGHQSLIYGVCTICIDTSGKPLEYFMR